MNYQFLCFAIYRINLNGVALMLIFIGGPGFRRTVVEFC